MVMEVWATAVATPPIPDRSRSETVIVRSLGRGAPPVLLPPWPVRGDRCQGGVDICETTGNDKGEEGRGAGACETRSSKTRERS